jgi:hypothetical protein
MTLANVGRGDLGPRLLGQQAEYRELPFSFSLFYFPKHFYK